MNILPAASTSFLIDALNRGGVDRVISSLYGLQYAPSDSSSSDDDSDTSSSEWDDDADDASYSSLSSASSVSSEDSFHRVFKSHFDGDEDETGLTLSPTTSMSWIWMISPRRVMAVYPELGQEHPTDSSSPLATSGDPTTIASSSVQKSARGRI